MEGSRWEGLNTSVQERLDGAAAETAEVVRGGRLYLQDGTTVAAIPHPVLQGDLASFPSGGTVFFLHSEHG